MTSSANSPKQHVIGLEKQNCELRSQLLANQSSLQSVEEQRIIVEEKLAEVNKEKDDLEARLKLAKANIKETEIKFIAQLKASEDQAT